MATATPTTTAREAAIREMTAVEEAARAHTLRTVATMIDKKPADMEWAELAQKLRRMAAAMGGPA